MKTVGIYIFTDMLKQRSAKKRDTYFDGQNYIGLRYIVSEIDKTKYNIRYVSKDTVDDVDYVLISIISYYDIINIIHELYGVAHKSKIIVGGPGALNIELIKDIIDYAVIGRGEGLINDILAGNVPDGVWSKKNYNFSNKVFVQSLKKYIEIEDPIMGFYKEKSIGCPKKCFFCEYSWKNKNVGNTKYDSGVADRETLFKDIEFSNYKNKDFVSAVDGINEDVRWVINKPLFDGDISKKIGEIYNQDISYVSLKLYCLLGYPFESGFDPVSLLDALTKPSGGKNRLNIVMVSPHFMPMPFTPMESEPVNNINFRKLINEYDFSPWQKTNIRVYWPEMTASSPINAFEATLIHRAKSFQTKDIKKILSASKYKSLNSYDKIRVLKKYFGSLFDKVDSVVPYIEKPYNTDGAKKVYRQRVQKLQMGEGHG